MTRNILNRLLMTGALLGAGIAAAATTNNNTPGVPDADIARKLTHEIRMYPRYSGDC